MTTPSRAKASAKFRAAQKAAGYQHKAFMLPPATLEQLARLAVSRGSETKAVIEAVDALAREVTVHKGGSVQVGVIGPGDVVTPVEEIGLAPKPRKQSAPKTPAREITPKADTLGVQFGPTKANPGDRLKKR